eukprot:jgi/Tetstr1/462661/TSEL_000689.t1
MDNVDTFALDVHRKRCEDDSPPALRRCLPTQRPHWDGGGSNHDNFKIALPVREAAAPRATFTKDVTKDSD